MTDRGYWARLGLEGPEPTPHDHPLGFRYGTIENGLLPRLAVLAKELTSPAQKEAFKAVLMELDRYCRQTNAVVEDLRIMARDLKNLEDNVAYGAHDLEQLRDLYRRYPDQMRFDPEAYKRSSLVNRDLSEALRSVDWEVKEAMGRRLDQRLEEARVQREQEARERHVVWAQEQKEKRKAALLRQTGVLYRTSPRGIDETVPQNLRKDIAAAEARLSAMGFALEVEGAVRCNTKCWGDFIVYADPRSGNSLRFNVYRGAERLDGFWIKDSTASPLEKFEAQLSKISATGMKANPRA